VPSFGNSSYPENLVIPGTRNGRILQHQISCYSWNNLPNVIPALSVEKTQNNSGQKMAAHFDDLWELAESYVDLFPPRHRANLLTDLDEVEFYTYCRDFGSL